MGEGNGNDMFRIPQPWFVNAIATVGVPSLIAVGTIYWILTTFAANMQTNQQQIAQSLADSAQSREQVSQVLRRLEQDRGAEVVAAEKILNDQREMIELVSNMRDILASNVDETGHAIRQTTKALQRGNWIQQRTCLNAAKDAYQAEKCLEPEKKP